MRIPKRLPEGLFQSTRPVRGATASRQRSYRLSRVSIHAPRAGRDIDVVAVGFDEICFNPRAPCGARRIIEAEMIKRGVSIHAPRAGRDSH